MEQKQNTGCPSFANLAKLAKDLYNEYALIQQAEETIDSLSAKAEKAADVYNEEQLQEYWDISTTITALRSAVLRAEERCREIRTSLGEELSNMPSVRLHFVQDDGNELVVEWHVFYGLVCTLKRDKCADTANAVETLC